MFKFLCKKQQPGKFKFSKRSLKNLQGVESSLVNVAKEVIKVTDVDFAVIDGLRTAEEQVELYRKGASKLDGYKKRSKHQDGLAIDILPYVGKRACWDVKLCADIMEWFRVVAIDKNVRLRWGGSWEVLNDINQGFVYATIESYKQRKLSQGKTPFIDAVHVELT